MRSILLSLLALSLSGLQPFANAKHGGHGGGGGSGGGGTTTTDGGGTDDGGDSGDGGCTSCAPPAPPCDMGECEYSYCAFPRLHQSILKQSPGISMGTVEDYQSVFG